MQLTLTTSARWSALTGAGLALLSACGQRTPGPAEPRAEAPRVTAVGTAASSVTPARLPPAGSAASRRVVRDAPCSPTSCDYRTETCCETEKDRKMSGCQSRPAGVELAERGHKCTGELSADWIGIDCTSTADCPSGLRCCATGELTHCAASCDEHEACVPGQKETCHEGSRCDASSSRSGGTCLVASPSVACGKTRCTGQNGCRYDVEARRWACVPLGPDGAWPERAFGAEAHLLRCTSPKDCGGERCCAGGPLPMTECSGSCMSGIDVCDTIADCPDFLGPPTDCRADPADLPFPKTCRYQGS